MDKFKEKTMSEYTFWDLDCKYLCPSKRFKKKFIGIIRKKARRKLKEELRKEIDNNGI